MPDSPPPVSETAAWTERDEANLGFYAGHMAFGPRDPCSANDAAIFAREILRLRAENERLAELLSRNVEKMATDGVEIERLTKELDETLDARMRKYKADQLDALLRSTTSRSRVSDNG